LAFDKNEDIINSKIAILIASTIAAITGFIFLKFKLKRD
jgi:Na+/H+ antiporter NhaA